jgi:hypothetical protein
VTHRATPDFWACYRALPSKVQSTGDRAFSLLKTDPRHASLHFKKVDRYWSAGVGLHHRALGVDVPDGVVWLWSGTHADYDKLVG